MIQIKYIDQMNHEKRMGSDNQSEHLGEGAWGEGMEKEHEQRALRSVCLSACLSGNLSLHLGEVSVYLSVCLSGCLSGTLCAFWGRSMGRTYCLSVCLPSCLAFFLSACLSVWHSVRWRVHAFLGGGLWVEGVRKGWERWLVGGGQGLSWEWALVAGMGEGGGRVTGGYKFVTSCNPLVSPVTSV